jgi:type I restriction enzyme M protein
VKNEKTRNLSTFTWSIADILRGDFKQSEYGKVILPFVVLRRLDCILERTKAAVLAAEKALPGGIDDDTRDMLLYDAAGDNIRVYNTSRFTFSSLKDFLSVFKGKFDCQDGRSWKIQEPCWSWLR